MSDCGLELRRKDSEKEAANSVLTTDGIAF